ncbi:MAG: ATP-binding cassette domain-containing protein [Bacilli bacterium]|nr:ATP-binding cassette domain-containing protein [Bacilli bacterium]
MNTIEIKGLTKYYGKHKGIENIDLTVKEGEIFGFVGKNGAGKTTTIRTILNMISPTSGSASICGLDCIKETKEIKGITAYLPGEVEYYQGMKVIDLLNYAISFCDEKDYDLIDHLCEYFELDKTRKINELSLGNRKKIGVIQALLKKPKVIILDEPTSGLDPLMQTKVFNLLLEEKKKGVTVFLSSHNLQEIERYCDRVAIIKDGQIVEVIEVNGNDREKKLFVKYITKDNVEHKYNFEGNINDLIKELSKLDLLTVEIRMQSIEEEFQKFYEGEKQ